jgi:hypothetical protein
MREEANTPQIERVNPACWKWFGPGFGNVRFGSKKRTFSNVRRISALPPKADIRNGSDRVRRSSSGSLAMFAAIRHSLAGRTQGAVSTYALVTHYGDGRKGRRFVFSFAALIASRRLGL